MKKAILLTLVLAANAAVAAPLVSDAHLLGSVETTEITPIVFNKSALIENQISPTTTTSPAVDPLERVGKVVGAAKDMVALGEAMYTLIQKGKPKNQTEYAPVSVVPRDPTTKEIMDPFELEGFSIPVERVFNSKIRNMSGKVVVNFTYKLIYSYGGSYNGTGKYLSAVQIVPASVQTKFGWDCNATMKVSGVMNHGTKANPVAGVIVAIKYQMNSWSSSFERNDTIHIAGNGAMKSYGIK